MHGLATAAALVAVVSVAGCAGIEDRWQALKVWVVNASGDERIVTLSRTNDPEDYDSIYAVPADGLVYESRSVALGSIEATGLSGWIIVYDRECRETGRAELAPGDHSVTIGARSLDVASLSDVVTAPPAGFLPDPSGNTCRP